MTGFLESSGLRSPYSDARALVAELRDWVETRGLNGGVVTAGQLSPAAVCSLAISGGVVSDQLDNEDVLVELPGDRHAILSPCGCRRAAMAARKEGYILPLRSAT